MKRPTSIAAVWSLVLYLALFPGFALLHAYAEGELVNDDGCAIGAWVHHANAPDSSESPDASLPCLVGLVELPEDTVLVKAPSSTTSRGPPSRSS